jgi:hypothetical protein
MYIGLHVKYPLFLTDFNETNFVDRFPNNTQHQISFPVGDELFHVDGET